MATLSSVTKLFIKIDVNLLFKIVIIGARRVSKTPSSFKFGFIVHKVCHLPSG